jgi:hypothetical protein
MSDSVGIFTLGLPVYNFVKDIAESAAKALGADADTAKAIGVAAGATASITTAVSVGCP